MKITLVGFIFFATVQVLAHGEDKHGPNGGYLKMPGSFHTEVKRVRNTLVVYLLDEKFQNPVTKSSKVEVTFNTSEGNILLTCKPVKEDPFFTCNMPDTKETIQSVWVWATRDEMKGNVAKYPWPLRLEKKPGGAIKPGTSAQPTAAQPAVSQPAISQPPPPEIHEH